MGTGFQMMLHRISRALAMACTGIVAMAGMAAPALAGPAALDLGQYRGKVVYVDFWASWCGPCKQSFPFMQGLAARHPDGDLVVLTVNVDRQRPQADAFLRQVRSTLPVVYDQQGDLAKTWKVADMPTSLVFGRDGKIRFRHQGFFPGKTGEYEAHITQLLRER